MNSGEPAGAAEALMAILSRATGTPVEGAETTWGLRCRVARARALDDRLRASRTLPYADPFPVRGWRDSPLPAETSGRSESLGRRFKSYQAHTTTPWLRSGAAQGSTPPSAGYSSSIPDQALALARRVHFSRQGCESGSRDV